MRRQLRKIAIRQIGDGPIESFERRQPADIALLDIGNERIRVTVKIKRRDLETGRMATTLFHGLSQLGFPVICVESRQAYQALKSLATHKTDRNDARGLAHLARTGFFKPVHVKSLPRMLSAR